MNYVLDPNGVKRYLGKNETPSDHLMMALPTFASRGFPLIKLKDLPLFDRVYKQIPIMDQGSIGSCLPHAWATACMLARATSGAPFVPLSPNFLYSLINRGIDQGSNSGDAITALATIGIAPQTSTPDDIFKPTIEAKVQANRFKLRDVVKLENFEEAANAAYYGWGICLGIRISSAFSVDSRSICTYIPGNNNHEVFCGEQLTIIDGKYYLGGRNSWGTKWGLNGRCFWSQAHVDNSQDIHAVRYMYDDPNDNELPPSL